RCSAVSLRLHTLGPRCLSGSGFPIPSNGSCITASTISRVRRAMRGLVSTHHARSSRNSTWKTETRRLLLEAKLLPQLVHGLRLSLLRQRAPQRGEQALGVLGRAEQVRRLDQALQLPGGHERDVFVAAAVDNHHVPLALDFLEKTREVLADIGVGSLPGHGRDLCDMYRITVHMVGAPVKRVPLPLTPSPFRRGGTMGGVLVPVSPG